MSHTEFGTVHTQIRNLSIIKRIKRRITVDRYFSKKSCLRGQFESVLLITVDP